jgi:hypothetical protein
MAVVLCAVIEWFSAVILLRRMHCLMPLKPRAENLFVIGWYMPHHDTIFFKPR